MYQAPTLERFGSFRELTLQRSTKRVIGDDLIPGIGLDCDANAPVGDPKACIRS
ncbi:MAG: lasso RiPP family leader peptide-containing protein [Gemmatimonadetes bacterium]|nr:lasso RiPP family leader peptide-containing protein [Gemmatimonadota bacterium]